MTVRSEASIQPHNTADSILGVVPGIFLILVWLFWFGWFMHNALMREPLFVAIVFAPIIGAVVAIGLTLMTAIVVACFLASVAIMLAAVLGPVVIVLALLGVVGDD